MDIVVASDEGYVVHMLTLICSICENNKDEEINIHIFDGGIKKESYSYVDNLKKKYNNLNTYSYRITDEIIEKKIGCRLSNDRSLTTYARIFIPELLHLNINKALYLDVDAIVLRELRTLFNRNTNNKPLAGVLDVNPYKRREAVGLNKDDAYINAGMILWNLDKCREIDLVNQFRKFLIDRNGNIDAMDQGTINGTLKGSIDVLPPKYNAMTPFFQKNADVLKQMGGWNKYYNQSEIDDALKNPVFVHFTPNMTTRPWVENCKHPLKDEYWKYRKLTGYPTNEIEKDNRSVKLKLLGWMYYNLPYKIYRKIVSK